eukprot:5496624-Amphidinium_carterae.1
MESSSLQSCKACGDIRLVVFMDTSARTRTLAWAQFRLSVFFTCVWRFSGAKNTTPQFHPTWQGPHICAKTPIQEGPKQAKRWYGALAREEVHGS